MSRRSGRSAARVDPAEDGFGQGGEGRRAPPAGASRFDPGRRAGGAGVGTIDAAAIEGIVGDHPHRTARSTH